MATEPAFDWNDNVWRCAPPCFCEVFRGECDGCGKVYDLTPEMEEHDQEVSLQSSVQWRVASSFAPASFRPMHRSRDGLTDECEKLRSLSWKTTP